MRAWLAGAVMAATIVAVPAEAGVGEAVSGFVLPGYARFAEATGTLAAAAGADCGAEGLRDEWLAAFDAWIAVGFLRLGPVEEEGRALAIAFWPDPKDAVPRAVAALLAEGRPDLSDPLTVSQISVAGRGLFALEQLLYLGPPGERSCAATRALAADLAAMAASVEAGWMGGFAVALETAGEAGNT